jgi:hypothetical protein
MHRRRFIALLGGAIALPCVAAVQQKWMPVIEVAFLEASADWAVATITSTLRATRSAANPGSRS